MWFILTARQRCFQQQQADVFLARKVPMNSMCPAPKSRLRKVSDVIVNTVEHLTATMADICFTAVGGDQSKAKRSEIIGLWIGF